MSYSVTLRPSSDYSNSNWTASSSGAALYTMISEATADDASTYITTSTSGASYQCATSGLPSGNYRFTGCTVYFRAYTSGTTSNTLTVYVRNGAGGSIICSTSPSCSTAFTTYSGSASFNLTSLSNLYIEFDSSFVVDSSAKVAIGSHQVTQAYIVLTYELALTFRAKIGDVIKTPTAAYCKVGNAWHSITANKEKIDGVWK